jgi:hypothetical protein
MSAVAFVARRRLADRRRALVAAGVLLGLGFGFCLASFAAARRTASAYDRILVAADAPDATVGLFGHPPEQAERALQPLRGITRQRVYGGFLGTAAGVDRILTTALLAPIHDPFPLERPTLQTGRLPNPDAADEAIVNRSAAARGGIEVGDRLHFRFFNPITGASSDDNITVVGIGTFPAEVVTDETNVLGVFVFGRAFYDAHRDLVVYSASNVDLAPGFDARGDLAPAVAARGYELQSARTQEQQAIDDALRPLIIVLVALGVLAFGGTAVATGQVIQRSRDHWLSDDERLQSLGMARHQIRGIEFAGSSIVAALAVMVALITMFLLSPTAPIGPLHDLDPAQGFGIDMTVAVLGAAAIIVTIGVLTLVFASVGHHLVRPMLRRSRWAVTMGGPTTAAGLTLALRTDRGHDRGWRAVAATTAAAAGLAMCAAFVSSAIALTDTPARYGFDANLVAVNAYGDQSESALAHAFGERDDVVAATGYTESSFLLNGHAVPGLAETAVKGKLTPTLLRGRPPRSPSEIVIGQHTLESVGARVGDVVKAQLLTAAGSGGKAAAAPVPLRIVGIATFPAVDQVGTDMPRLGIGALVTREAFLRMHGSPANGPEFTVVRLAPGADPSAVIAANRHGFQDAAQTTTAWFTDTKPAEVRQLDGARPYLRGALVVGFMILLAVVVHALWSRARASRHDLAVLRVIGSTRRQLDAVTAWQVAPFALAAALLGIPFGIALGRLLYRLFAQSLAVVNDASTSAAVFGALVLAVLMASAIADLVAMTVTRRTRAQDVLRQG